MVAVGDDDRSSKPDMAESKVLSGQANDGHETWVLKATESPVNSWFEEGQEEAVPSADAARDGISNGIVRLFSEQK